MNICKCSDPAPNSYAVCGHCGYAVWARIPEAIAHDKELIRGQWASHYTIDEAGYYDDTGCSDIECPEHGLPHAHNTPIAKLVIAGPGTELAEKYFATTPDETKRAEQFFGKFIIGAPKLTDKDFDFKPARSIDYDEVQKPINRAHASIDAAGTVTIAAHYTYATGEDLDNAVWPLNRSVACLPVWGWEYSAKADIGGAYWYSVHPESDAHLRKRYALALTSNWTR